MNDCENVKNFMVSLSSSNYTTTPDLSYFDDEFDDYETEPDVESMNMSYVTLLLGFMS